jgi:hypothetical protein
LATLLLVLLAWLGSPSALASQTLTIELTAVNSGPNEPIGWHFQGEILAGGERHAYPLHQDTDGHWKAEFSVAPVAVVGVVIRAVGPDNQSWLIHSGSEVLAEGDSTLHFALTGPPPGTAHRLSRTELAPKVAQFTEGLAVISAAWGLLVLVLVLGLVRRGRGVLQTGLGDAGWSFPAIWEPALWLGLSLLWTWPAALAGPGRLVGRHFDTQGTIWTIHAAPRLLSGLTDPLTCWPLGAEYSTIDSFTLLPIAAALQFMDAIRLHAWLGILGVALSAWAASSLAQAMGARRPWSLIAGGVFAFSGLAASALLEGHVYHVLNPWMPLMCWALWRATSPEGGLRHGVLGGLCFSVSLLTTGYLGLAGAILATGMLMGGLWVRRAAILPVLAGFLVVALPVGLAYLSLFTGDAEVVAGYASPETLRMGSVSMATIGLPSAEVDRVGHSWAMVLSPLALTLVLLSGRLLGPDPRRRALVLSGTLALVLAMGPHFVVGLGPSDPVLPSPFQWVWDLPGGSYLRFPGRIAWAWNLVAGVIGALAAQALAVRVGRRARLLLLVLAVEVFLCVGLPFRQVSRLATAPAALGLAEGPIFEFLPEGTNPNGEVESWLSAMSCLHQVDHGQAIADDCVTVPASSSPRALLGRWVGARVLEGNASVAWERLSGLGFSAVTWHPDLVHPTTNYRVEEALGQLEELRPEEGHNDGQVRIFQLPEGVAPDPSIPSPQGASAIAAGQTTVANWRPRIGLSVPPSLLGSGRYFVRLHPAGGEPKKLELRDGGGSGGWAGDGLLMAGWKGPVQGDFAMSILAVKDGEWTELWTGQVDPVAGTEDPLIFRMSASGDAAWPALVALDTFAPEVVHRGGWLQLIGWALFALCFILGIVVRRPRGPSPRVAL